MKRAIQKEIENPLGRLILEGKIRDGEKVVADKGEQGLEFVPAKEKKPVVE